MAKGENKKKEPSKSEEKQKKKEEEDKKKSEKKEKSKQTKNDNKKVMSYDPCPHRVWTPKPGERDKSAPRGEGAPWYEKVRKKVDVDKEEAEKQKEKEEKSARQRKQAREEKQKKKEEEDKKKKEEEEKKKEEDKKKSEKKEKREKAKKKKENEKRKKQKEEREKEKQRKKEEEEKEKEKEEGKVKGKSKKKEQPVEYDPCPHKVYTPKPGEKDLADPAGVGAPWHVPIRKKEDVDKEEKENEEEKNKKRKEESNKRKKEKEEQQEIEDKKRQKQEEKMKQKEMKRQERMDEEKEERNQRMEERRQRNLEKDQEMGSGVREGDTNFTPELTWMMDFIQDVDEKDRARRGAAVRWKKEEIEREIESQLAKEAYTTDFRNLVNMFVEAEWGRADKKLKRLEKEEKVRRKQMLQNMDPLAKDMIQEGKRFQTLYEAMMGSSKLNKGEGEGPNPTEDLMVNMIMQEMESLDQKSGQGSNLMNLLAGKHLLST